jgi:hypothetical protein
MDIKAKCRHLKIFACKWTLRQVFICLSCTYIYLFTERQRGGGGGRVEPDKPALTADNKETHMKKEPHILFMYVTF